MSAEDPVFLRNEILSLRYGPTVKRGAGETEKRGTGETERRGSGETRKRGTAETENM
jgi:hypothetical protein